MACTGVIWSRYSTIIKPVGGLHIFSEYKMFNQKGRFIPSKLNSRADKFAVDPSLAVLSLTQKRGEFPKIISIQERKENSSKEERKALLSSPQIVSFISFSLYVPTASHRSLKEFLFIYPFNPIF